MLGCYLAVMRYLLPLLMTTLAALAAPGFLFTADAPGQADAVILFVGPDNEPRLEEARQLIEEGKARYLLIPAWGELYLSAPGGLVKVAGDRSRGKLFFRIRKSASYQNHFENTHIEALEARRMLDDLGLKSALLVSSGYHMRRIRLIARRVFDARKYSVYCNPVRLQRPFGAADWFDRERGKTIVSEYLKIGWFLGYGVFSR